jgi:branched-chain amino acid transport system ATP-binding protein
MRASVKIGDRLRERVTAGAPLFPLVILFGLVCVDEFDRTAFGLLTPDIRDYFHLHTEGIFAVVSLVAVLALIGTLPIGYFADRVSRSKLAIAGAIVWGLFTLLSGLAPGIVLLILFRAATGTGRAVNEPTHNSLLSDYYPPQARVSVFYVYRYGIALGIFLGFAVGGLLAAIFNTWRAPFLFFWIPTAVFVVLAMWKLRDPVRGAQERAAMQASAETVATEEAPPSYGEAWRICNQVKSLRRIWYSLPFFAISLVGFINISSILYHDVFHVSVFRRGLIGAATEPLQIIGVFLGIKIATRYLATDPGKILTFTAITSGITALTIVGLALAPNVWFAISMNVLFTIPGSIIVPGIYAVLSLTIPPRARSLGFSIGNLWVLPGLVLFPVVGGLADNIGIRGAMLVAVVPIFLIGAAIIVSAGQFVENDIRKVRASSVAQAEVLAARRKGQVKLLLVKDLDVSYSGTQVLFGVNFEIDEGEIVALLGTNGAGKTTLLKTISGLVEAEAGAIIFDGRDMTYATPNEIAARGVVQVPGGEGRVPKPVGRGEPAAGRLALPA